MVTILFRTVFIYVLLLATMRFMGKRQLGELEISELVTTLLISEIASLPIVDQSIPVMHAIIPLITILTLEITLSVLLLKIPALKSAISARPSVLIRHGVLDQREMRRIRISNEELLSELRQSGIASPEDVDYAILEQNGKISIILKKSAQPPSANALNIIMKENGIMHVLISDGTPNRYNMDLLHLTDGDLERMLEGHGGDPRNIFLLCMDDEKNLFCIDKQQEAKK